MKNDILTASSSGESLKRPIAALMEEIKPLVTEKNEFQNGDVSILVAIFAKFGQQKLRCKNENKDFPKESSTASVKLLMEILMEKTKTVIMEDDECEKRDDQILTALSGTFGRRRF